MKWDITKLVAKIAMSKYITDHTDIKIHFLYLKNGEAHVIKEVYGVSAGCKEELKMKRLKVLKQFIILDSPSYALVEDRFVNIKSLASSPREVYTPIVEIVTKKETFIKVHLEERYGYGDRYDILINKSSFLNRKDDKNV